MPVTWQIQLRQDTAANWSSSNPVLAIGELGLDTTNWIVKVGNGSTAWNSLTVALVLTGSTQTLNAKTIGDKLDITAVSQPATPSAGTTRLYSRTGVSTLDSLAYLNTLGVPIVLGRDVVFFAKNTSGASITKGSVVCINSASASIPLVIKAQADSGMTKLPAVGVVVADIPNNTVGMVMITGTINNVNTSGVGAGSTLYVSPTTAGLFTDTRPTHPNVIQPIGECLNSNASTGAILVNCTEINAGLSDGTNQTSWAIGDGTGAAARSVLFKNSNTGTLQWTPSASRTITLPDGTGTVYISGGTDVALADGGTGASLTDPNADRIMFWDDSAGAMTWLTPGTNLSITGTTLNATGGGGSTTIPFKTVGPTGSGATYETDGTADQTEINTAIASFATTGGIVWLLPGTYNLSASIAFDGTGNPDTSPTIMLLGAGMHTTKLVAATNVDAITLTDCSSVVIKDLMIGVMGSGSGIKSTVGAGHLRPFWNSLFENLYIYNSTGGTHTGWGMSLENAFRSRFANIEMFDLHNGFKVVSTNAAFNPGDCSVDRMFIELDGNTGSVAYQLESPTSLGSVNQMTFNMCEAIDSAASGTGILITGSGTEGGHHNIFTGINLEQFATVLNITHGNCNRFDFNYIESRAAGSFFVFGAGAFNNRIRSVGFVGVFTKTNTVINDGNTNAENPNIIEQMYLGVDTGGTANATLAASTKILSIGGYNSGTVNAALAIRRPGERRVISVASSATPAINTDIADDVVIGALAVNVTSFTTNLTGTGRPGQTLWIQITGTATRTLAWGASFEASTVALPTTTSGTTRLDVGFKWNTVTSKWRCVAVA